jgi:hypothetical protein
MKPTPQRRTVRNNKHKYAACESGIGEKGLSAAAVGVVCRMFCAPAPDEGNAFSFQSFAVGRYTVIAFPRSVCGLGEGCIGGEGGEADQW